MALSFKQKGQQDLRTQLMHGQLTAHKDRFLFVFVGFLFLVFCCCCVVVVVVVVVVVLLLLFLLLLFFWGVVCSFV